MILRFMVFNPIASYVDDGHICIDVAYVNMDEAGCVAKVNVAITHYSKRTRIFRIENLVRAAYNRRVEKSMHARPNRLNQ